MIYLDNAATRKPTQGTIDIAFQLMSEVYGNPSSSHGMGRNAQRYLEDARTRCADALRCGTWNIFFTSGASESNSQIIETAVLCGARTGRKHIVSTSVEHSSVLLHLKALEKKGFEVSYAKPNRNGNVEVDAVKKLIRTDTFFVSVMLVNNETGAIQDVETIAKYCHERDILFHTDATQGAGMEQMQNLWNSSIDFLSLSGHKIGAGMGAGLLYMSPFAKKKLGIFSPQPIVYGHQEQGSRGGTHNLPAIVALSEELSKQCRNHRSYESKIAKLEKELLIELAMRVPFQLNCSKNRKPGILSIRFPNIRASSLVEFLSSNGIYISTGSACTSGIPEASFVLQEMGLNHAEADETVRISVKEDTSLCDLLELTENICRFRSILFKISSAIDI